MKRIIVLLLTVVLACAALSAAAETRIMVRGNGEVLLPADTAVVMLGVNEHNEDVLAAQAAVNEKIEAIRAALTKAGIAKEDINTDRLYIYAAYDYLQGEERITGYNASSSLAIRTTDMESVGKIIDIAFAAGANSLNNVQFSASETAEASAEALTKAVLNARAKAEAIAAAAGMTIKGVETISEGYTYNFTNGRSMVEVEEDAVAEMEIAYSAAKAATQVQAAKVSVTADLTAVYIAE